jgi:hypothetical protein
MDVHIDIDVSHTVVRVGRDCYPLSQVVEEWFTKCCADSQPLPKSVPTFSEITRIERDTDEDDEEDPANKVDYEAWGKAVGIDATAQRTTFDRRLTAEQRAALVPNALVVGDAIDGAAFEAKAIQDMLGMKTAPVWNTSSTGLGDHIPRFAHPSFQGAFIREDHVLSLLEEERRRHIPNVIEGASIAYGTYVDRGTGLQFEHALWHNETKKADNEKVFHGYFVPAHALHIGVKVKEADSWSHAVRTALSELGRSDAYDAGDAAVAVEALLAAKTVNMHHELLEEQNKVRELEAKVTVYEMERSACLEWAAALQHCAELLEVPVGSSLLKGVPAAVERTLNDCKVLADRAHASGNALDECAALLHIPTGALLTTAVPAAVKELVIKNPPEFKLQWRESQHFRGYPTLHGETRFGTIILVKYTDMWTCESHVVPGHKQLPTPDPVVAKLLAEASYLNALQSIKDLLA